MYGKEQEDKEKKGGFKLIRLVMAVLSVVLLLAIMPVYSYNPEEVDYVRAGMGELTHNTNLFGIMGVYASWSLLTERLEESPVFCTGWRQTSSHSEMSSSQM